MTVERLARALQDEWRAMTETEPELAARFGLETAEIDGVFASRCGPGGSLFLNKAMLPPAPVPATTLAALRQWFGDRPYAVGWTGACGEETAGRLLAQGLSLHEREWMLAGTAAPLPTAPPGVRIELLPPEATQDVEALTAQGFPLHHGSPFDALLASLGRRRPDCFRRYLALLDGRPAGTAVTYLFGGVAGLYGATTLPDLRGRGIQTALIARRLADAFAAGATLAYSCVGDFGGTSQRNLERMGLRVVQESREYTLGEN